jgi:hypothetical protein
MKINPTKITWGRVTERTDGSTIPGEINYNVGTAGADGAITHHAILVGSLQPDNTFSAPIADMSFEPGVHTLALSATEVATGLTSAWSNTVAFEIVVAKPKPPLAVAVA